MMSEEQTTREGYDQLWGWFGLSRSAFLTLPQASEAWRGKPLRSVEWLEAELRAHRDVVGEHILLTREVVVPDDLPIDPKLKIRGCFLEAAPGSAGIRVDGIVPFSRRRPI